MPGVSRKTAPRTYEVVVSFNGLNKGERFEQAADDLGWALQHVQAGYLRDVTEEVVDVRGEEG